MSADHPSMLHAGHGHGRRTPHVEVTKPEELRPASPAAPVRADRGADGRWCRGNNGGRAKLVRPGKLGGVDTSHKDFRPFKRWARTYASHRRTELAAAHGGEISAGVGAIVESAALALGAARYLQQLAATTLDPDMFKRAADLGALARQHELAAWELAARESKARPKKTRLPWSPPA